MSCFMNGFMDNLQMRNITTLWSLISLLSFCAFLDMNMNWTCFQCLNTCMIAWCLLYTYSCSCCSINCNTSCCQCQYTCIACNEFLDSTCFTFHISLGFICHAQNILINTFMSNCLDCYWTTCYIANTFLCTMSHIYCSMATINTLETSCKATFGCFCTFIDWWRWTTCWWSWNTWCLYICRHKNLSLIHFFSLFHIGSRTMSWISNSTDK